MAAPRNLVNLKDVEKGYGSRSVLRDITLGVAEGDRIGIVGRNGDGKSTLLRLIGGVEPADAGAVTRVNGLHLDMLGQGDDLDEHKTVREELVGGRADHEWAGDRTFRSVLDGLLGGVEMRRFPNGLDTPIGPLSGGERRRIALARLLLDGPELLLLDEPTNHLDATLRADLRREVALILREAGATALLVTHDQEEALTLGDRLAVMREGVLVQTGAPSDVYARPADRWTAQFVGEVNVLAGVADGASVQTEVGELTLAAPATGPVHVALRPEQLRLEAGHDPNSEVVDRDFRGHDVLYRLRHQAGLTLLVQLPSLELHEVGAQVFVGPVAAAVAPVVD